MDAVHIKAGRYKYLIVARDDLSGWVEAKALVKLDSRSVTCFSLENLVQRYRPCQRVTVDGGPELQGDLIEGPVSCGIKRDSINPYHLELHGMIIRGHQRLKDALVELCGESGTKWREYLPLVLFADRILTKRTTGLSPFEVVFGQQAVLPVDIEWETFLGIDLDEVTTTEELLEARFQQLA